MWFPEVQGCPCFAELNLEDEMEGIDSSDMESYDEDELHIDLSEEGLG